MTLSIDQALQQGVAAHKEGKVQEAEGLYRAILQSQPLHPDANYNLGVLTVSVKCIALALFTQISIPPNSSFAFSMDSSTWSSNLISTLIGTAFTP